VTGGDSESPSPPEPGASGTQFPCWPEVAAVVATGLLHVAAWQVGLVAPFIALAACGWTAFVCVRVRRSPKILAEWGLTRARLGRAFRAATLLAAPAIAGMAVYAIAERGTLAFAPAGWLVLALYPAWGLVQQFLLQSMIVRNLRYSRLRPNYALTLLVGAALFSLAHVPNVPLMLGTFALGLVFIPLYLRHWNLWPLGIWHGWLGAFFYLWVLGRDPWNEIMGRLGS
jgi:hypothetical protein